MNEPIPGLAEALRELELEETAQMMDSVMDGDTADDWYRRNYATGLAKRRQIMARLRAERKQREAELREAIEQREADLREARESRREKIQLVWQRVRDWCVGI